MIKFQETGRFGRITKNMRKLGFEEHMEDVLFDSLTFPTLNKKEQTRYIETIMDRMQKTIGLENTYKVLEECGAQCCGKSWSSFAKQIWDCSATSEDFFVSLNREEKKYNTHISYDSMGKNITVTREKCICGMINKGNVFEQGNVFCNCSIGHMNEFFSSIFEVRNVKLVKSIYSGDKMCQWIVSINK